MPDISDMILPVMGALVVGLLVWGIIQIITGVSSEKKRIQERLGGEGRSDTVDLAAFTVTRKTIELHGMSKSLGKLPMLQKVAHQLSQVWPRVSLAKFVYISLAAFVVVGAIVTAITVSFPMGAAVGLGAMFVPLMALRHSFAKRQTTMMNQLPEALDFLSRILRSGHSLSTGLQMMAQELPQPLAGEFRRCYDQHSLGQSFEDSLKDTALRIDSSDFGFFVTAVLIQRQTGGDLSEVLDNISNMIRQRIRLQMNVKAKTAEGRFTGYILVAFPGVMFALTYYLNPQYAGDLVHTSSGLKLLGTAFGLCMLGLFAIRKITQIKV